MVRIIRSLFLFILETLKIVVISLAIIIPIRYFLIQPFLVVGSSMQPNFESGDYLIIDELSYRFYTPKRGDIIVFRYPKDTRQYYIKRIIGLSDETVRIEKGKIFITNADNPDGFYLDESGYDVRGYTYGNTTITIKDNEFFVLGDNRLESSDSRKFGAVSKKYIIGKAWIRAFPFNKIGILSIDK